MRKILIVTIGLLMNMPVCAQKTMREVWMEMPDSILAYLDSNMRHELVDFSDMGAKTEVRNLLQGKTALDSISERYVGLRLNDASCLQMRLLDMADSTQMICMVKTVCAPEPESVVRFYSSDWKSMDGDYGLPLSEDESVLLSQFVHRPDTMSQERFEELRGMIFPVMQNVSLSDSDDIVTVSLSVPLLTKKDAEDVKAIIKQSKFKWNGLIFKEC